MASFSRGECGDSDSGSSKAVVFLAIENPSASNNLGDILRTAAAYAVVEVLLVGYGRCAMHGSHGAAKYVTTAHFSDWPSAIANLRNERKCEVIALLPKRPEVGAASDGSHGGAEAATPPHFAVYTRPFSGDTALLLFHGGQPPLDVLRLCDTAVYVEQATSLVRLPLPIVAAVALHHFTAWAQYGESHSSGQKFYVAARQQQLPDAAARGKVAARRAQQRREAEEKAEVDAAVRAATGGLDVLFFEDG